MTNYYTIDFTVLSIIDFTAKIPPQNIINTFMHNNSTQYLTPRYLKDKAKIGTKKYAVL